MKRMIFTISLVFISLISVYSQSPYTVIPIAADSLLDETDPYITRFWYDGWFDFDLRTSANTNNIHPLWITYVETDNNIANRVAAVNIGFEWNNPMSLSEKYVITETPSTSPINNPVIENYLGKPIAIWTETTDQITKIKYSLILDSTWSTPRKITEAIVDSLSFVFFTEDSYNLFNQTSSENLLIWYEDNTIYQTSLDSDFMWDSLAQNCELNGKITSLNLAENKNGDIWLVFDERITPDSVQVHTLVRKENSDKWNGPFSIMKIAALNSQAEINISNEYSQNPPMSISWVDNFCFRDTLIQFISDSLLFSSTGNHTSSQVFPDLKFTANKLALGGCVIEASPYFFSSYKLESICNLHISQYFFGIYNTPVHTTNNRISKLTMSGLNDDNFIVGWEETSSEQSDIYIYVNHISIGNIDNQSGNIPDAKLLGQNYPNPFNPTTTIHYSLPESNNAVYHRARPSGKGGLLHVELAVYDLLGQYVTTLVSEQQHLGNYEIMFAASYLSSGVYYYKLTVEQYSETRKMIFVK